MSESQFTFQYGQIYYMQKKLDLLIISKFTFQYGQIYYMNFLLENKELVLNLHSNMVRFIIGIDKETTKDIVKFTFQYGQIYYSRNGDKVILSKVIYIPIWLDLLSFFECLMGSIQANLHSNMVRFIIKRYGFKYSPNRHIYIPIWLDLLLQNKIAYRRKILNLHSNMVRFIIQQL